MSHRSIVLAALLLCGCYEYLPPPAAARAPDLTGKRVQVILTDVGSALLASEIGPLGEAVGGTLVEDSQESLVVAVVSVRNRNGFETGWNGERVAVPRTYVAHLEERRFSKRRTFFASMAFIGGLVIAQRAFGGLGGANAPGGSPGGTGSPR